MTLAIKDAGSLAFLCVGIYRRRRPTARIFNYPIPIFLFEDLIRGRLLTLQFAVLPACLSPPVRTFLIEHAIGAYYINHPFIGYHSHRYPTYHSFFFGALGLC